MVVTARKFEEHRRDAPLTAAVIDLGTTEGFPPQRAQAPIPTPNTRLRCAWRALERAD